MVDQKSTRRQVVGRRRLDRKSGDLDLLEDAQHRAGTATELDTLNTRVRLAAAETVKLDLENGREKQLIMLRRLMGFEDKAPLRLRGEFTHQPVNLDLAALVGRA